VSKAAMKGNVSAANWEKRLFEELDKRLLATSSPTPAARSLNERLTELSDLKAAGKITEEEYATMRRKVIESYR
jgi:hypothetical protein